MSVSCVERSATGVDGAACARLGATCEADIGVAAVPQESSPSGDDAVTVPGIANASPFIQSSKNKKMHRARRRRLLIEGVPLTALGSEPIRLRHGRTPMEYHT